MNIRHDHVRTYRLALDSADLSNIEPSFARMEGDARSAMIDEGMPPERITMVRAAGMRYLGQSWDLIVRLPDRADAVRDLERLFHETHEQRFGYRAADPVEIVSLRVSAIGQVTKPELGGWSIEGTLESALRETRSAYFSGEEMSVPVYLRDRLPGHARFFGPAIVEEMGSVTIVPPGWQAEVGRLGELQLKRKEP